MTDTSIPETRPCAKCKQPLPLTPEYFYRNSACKHGLAYKCKSCMAIERQTPEEQAKIRERARRYRELHREEIRENHRKWRHSPAGKATRKAYTSTPEYRARQRELSHTPEYREKGRIRSRKKYALRVKTTPKPQRVKALKEKKPKKPENRDRSLSRVTSGYMRELREGARPKTFTTDDWKRCLEYFNWSCAACGRQMQDLFGAHTPSADHWIPMTSPDCPGTVPHNVVPLCHGLGGCNNSKGAKLPDVWLEKKFGKRKAQEITERVNAYFHWLESQ